MAEFFYGLNEIDDAIIRANETGSILPESLYAEDSALFKGLEESGLRAGDFAIGEKDGEYFFMRNEEPVNLREATDIMNNKGDFIEAMESLGVPRAELDDPCIIQYNEELKSAWKEMRGNQDIVIVEETLNIGNEMEHDLGDPKSASEFADAIDRDPSIKADLDDKIDNLRKQLKDPSEKFKAGKWIKRSVLLGIGVLSATKLYEMIDRHRKAMNGCWLVNIESGRKCKVKNLSCATTIGPFCGTIPCPDNKCFGDATCILRHKHHDQDGHGKKCTLTMSEACDNVASKTCSPYCSSKKVQVPRGYRLSCVNANFWSAADDLLGGIVNVGTSWLKYIVIGGIILLAIALFFFFRK